MSYIYIYIVYIYIYSVGRHGSKASCDLEFSGGGHAWRFQDL